MKIKVDDEEVTQGEDGMYLVEVDNSQDNSSLWAGITSETSQVKIKDTNGETSYDSPSNQKNISLKENITDVTVTVKNGAGEEKEYIVRIQKETTCNNWKSNNTSIRSSKSNSNNKGI